MITNQKIDVANILKDIAVDGLTISKYHKKPKIFTKLPAITYIQTNDKIKPFLNKEFNEKGTFQIDVWSDKVSDVSKIVIEVKKAMLEHGFYFEEGMDFDDPSEINRYIMFFERR